MRYITTELLLTLRNKKDVSLSYWINFMHNNLLKVEQNFITSNFFLQNLGRPRMQNENKMFY